MGFLLEYLKNPRFIGAVAPSGINLSRRMIRPINFKTAKVIVEYGPGTGSFTRELVIHRNPGTALLLIERNPLFCDELKKLYEIMTDTDGIYGGRFSGAGFKGCCMALIDPDKAERTLSRQGRLHRLRTAVQQFPGGAFGTYHARHA